jgi:hypothetical protein
LEGRVVDTVSVYVASTFPDMRSERELLSARVLSDLRALLGEANIALELIDLRQGFDDERDAELNVLSHCFEEMRQRHPIFICILGERYGFVPDRIPTTVAEQEPWIDVYSGLSVTELEILYAVLDQNIAEYAFFYFRDPRYLQNLPEGTNPSDFTSESEALAENINRLKERIRNSGFPVREYADPDMLAELVIQDLAGSGAVGWKQRKQGEPEGAHWGIVTEERHIEEPILTPIPEERPDLLPYVNENAQFTVYRPRSVSSGKWYPLIAFAHLSERPADAREDEPDPIEEVRRQASQLLGEALADFQDLTQESLEAIPQGGEITFVPEIAGITFNPSRRTFFWQESVHREEFRFRAPSELDGRVARGRMSVFWGNILVAEVGLAVRVENRGAASRGSVPLDSNRAAIYRKIFASYSHTDVPIVEEFERYAQAVGDEFFRDVIHLRTGQVWDGQLRKMIAGADVFQLFWSSNSIKSAYVEREWRYALSLGRSHFVRPVYWQDPMPEVPERNLPPDELRRLHFQRIYPVAHKEAISFREHPENKAVGEQHQPLEVSRDRDTRVAKMPPSEAKVKSKKKLTDYVLLKNIFLFIMLLVPFAYMTANLPHGFRQMRVLSFVDPLFDEPGWSRVVHIALTESVVITLFIECLFLISVVLGWGKPFVEGERSYSIFGRMKIGKRVFWSLVTLAASVAYSLEPFLRYLNLGTNPVDIDEDSIISASAYAGQTALAKFAAVWIAYVFVRWIIIGSIKAWRRRKETEYR